MNWISAGKIADTLKMWDDNMLEWLMELHTLYILLFQVQDKVRFGVLSDWANQTASYQVFFWLAQSLIILNWYLVNLIIRTYSILATSPDRRVIKKSSLKITGFLDVALDMIR